MIQVLFLNAPRLFKLTTEDGINIVPRKVNGGYILSYDKKALLDEYGVKYSVRDIDKVQFLDGPDANDESTWEETDQNGMPV